MWPKTLIDAFEFAFQGLELEEGYTKDEALIYFLDSAAKMAVWRCKGNPAGLEGAYFWPYTPIGYLTTTGLGGVARSVSLGGPSWGDALDMLKEYIRANAERICEAYKDDPIEYPDQI